MYTIYKDTGNINFIYEMTPLRCTTPGGSICIEAATAPRVSKIEMDSLGLPAIVKRSEVGGGSVRAGY
jgi:hypothetical protein